MSSLRESPGDKTGAIVATADFVEELRIRRDLVYDYLDNWPGADSFCSTMTRSGGSWTIGSCSFAKSRSSRCCHCCGERSPPSRLRSVVSWGSACVSRTARGA